MYDEKMAKFRDFKKEATDMIKAIGLEREHSLLEIGTGTGNFAIEAASHCKNIYAVDVSSTMIAYAKRIHRDWILHFFCPLKVTTLFLFC